MGDNKALKAFSAEQARAIMKTEACLGSLAEEGRLLRERVEKFRIGMHEANAENERLQNEIAELRRNLRRVTLERNALRQETTVVKERVLREVAAASAALAQASTG